MIRPEPSNLLTAAMRYADVGHPVFPCRSGAKKPITEHGLLDASTDKAQIAEWWGQHPDANIAIRTDGLIVIDVDGPDNSWLLDDVDKQQELANAPTSITPRGGRHHIFRAPNGRTYRNSASKVAPHVDVRADGGYIVAPPSVVDGKTYRWLEGSGLDWPPEELTEPPSWLLEILDGIAANRGRASEAQSGGGADDRSLIPEGNRNATLTSMAGSMRRRGMSESAILAALHQTNQEQCQPPLDDREVQKIAESVSRYEPVYTKPAPATSGGLPATDRPYILISTEEYLAIDQTIEALRADPGLYRRGPVLVRVLRVDSQPGKIKRHQGSCITGIVPSANLRERMTKYAQFQSAKVATDSDKPVLVHPTKWLVEGVLHRGEWPNIRPLRGLADTPFLRPDGTICQEAGYDQDTGVLLVPNAQIPPLPDEVGSTEVEIAVQAIMHAVCDFRFQSEADQAVWLAALLTLLSRYAFHGPAPLFLVDANVRGAGKGLLVQTIANIVFGHDMPVSSYIKGGEEMRKQITSIALAGDRCVLLDNIVGTFGNDALDRVLTSTVWKDRVLGRSELVELPIEAVWFGTGNNIAIAADTARRCLHIRLEVMTERPEERVGFAHPELLEWVRGNRTRLLYHGLVILKYYCQAGRPRSVQSAFGSFEEWSALIRNAVVVAGLPDPCDTRDRLLDTADAAGDALSQLLAAWQEFDPTNSGLTASDIITRLYPSTNTPPQPEAAVSMRNAIENLTGASAGHPPTTQMLGKRLSTVRMRVKDGLMLDVDPTWPKNKGARWKLYAANTDSHA
ncbi:MAG: hypothetical protein D8M59_03820 [Planctomycetes bacterium]|nr:hypothetical protein [Planctomycetota bacterium]NOG53123.1 hypothetical protein [Planctomycetota bacterium]